MLQGALFLPKPDWEAPSVASLPSWSDAKRICVDIETHDPKLRELGPGVRRGGYICGVAFAIEDGPSFYLPIDHAGGGNLPKEQVLEYLRDQSNAFTGTVVGTNLSYDLDFLAEVGVNFPQASWFRDVQVAEPLIDELQDRYSLDAIAARYGLAGKASDEMAAAAEAMGLRGHVGQHIWKLPAAHVAEYALQDVRLPLQLLRLQEREIERQNLERVWDLESRLLPVLVRMRRRGVLIDQRQLERVQAWSTKAEQESLDEIFRHTGVRVELGDVWGVKSYEKVCREIGAKPPMLGGGKVSIKTEWLESLGHPVANAMVRARKVNKLRSTFVESIRAYMTNGRIHCTLNQLRRERDDGGLSGAAFGRLSSEHPNMQQQPARDPEMGPMWRSIYVPNEGGVWACLDYSQQEPRLLTHYAEVCKCAGAHQAAARYRVDPTTDNHSMMAEITGLPRKQAKNIFLGLCYGMGSGKLAIQCGLPTRESWSEKHQRMMAVAGAEAQFVLDRFNERVPYVRGLAKLCEKQAMERGYLTTLMGRRCRFPMRSDKSGYDWAHKALNRLIQGGSADQTKAAMVEAEAAGYELQLQVHDELDLTVARREDADGLAEIMRNVVALRVPSKVDIETGPSWGEVR